MVEIANKITAMVSAIEKLGIAESKAAAVTCTPSETSTPYSTIFPSKLAMIITKEVMVQITTVSIKGSSKATNPSEAGYLVLTAACAVGAEPKPRSEEHTSELRSRGHLVCR